jgi:hypothetical protein
MLPAHRSKIRVAHSFSVPLPASAGSQDKPLVPKSSARQEFAFLTEE